MQSKVIINGKTITISLKNILCSLQVLQGMNKLHSIFIITIYSQHKIRKC